MPERVPYQRREFVRDRFEPNTRTMLQLMQLAGQARTAGIRERGQAGAQGLINLGQFIAGSLGNWRQDREKQAALTAAGERQAREDAMKARDQQLREADLIARMQDREADNAFRAEQQQRALQADAEKRGDLRADNIGYGPMGEQDVDTVMQSPARGGDVRYAFGPGTANGPELQPTQTQRDAIAARTAIEGMGGTLGPNGQVVMAPKPEREPNPTEYSLAWAAAQGDPMAKRALEIRNQFQQKPPSENQPLVPIVGPDGKTRYGTREEARGQIVPSGQNKPATGLEKRALNFFNRAEQADKDLETMEAEIQQLGLLNQARMEVLPNWLQTQQGQLYRQAQRAFTEARLRKDSGAAIPEQEFKNDRQTYFAQPGDTAETLEQKRRGRAAVLASLGNESGQALGEFVGDPEEARAIVQRYRQRSELARTVDEKAPVSTLKPGQSVTVGGFTVTLRPQ